MNIVVLVGRITRDPDTRRTADGQKVVSRFNLAVERRFKKDGEQNADFISCVAFGKTAEFVEKYAKKGMKFNVSGRLNTGKYTDKDGKTVYTTDVVIDEIEFGESKNAKTEEAKEPEFMTVPDEIEAELPFN